MNRLDGKVALISGAARGIGAETARIMVDVGAKVVIGDLRDELGQETAQKLGANCEYVHLDVTKEADWNAAVKMAEEKFGGLDILVNNAGLFTGLDLEEATLEDWDRLAGVNMTGVFLGTKLCTAALAARGKDSPHGSAIVNLSSIAGLVGSQLDPLYSMTKGGVALFTKSCALYFPRKGYRIRCNSVHPGVIDTDMGAQTFEARAQKQGMNDPSKAKEFSAKMHPIGRLGTPEDIAKGVVYLASDDSAFMTGSGLVIDGGITAQ
ncbi:MAG TPA: SDR family oxidoreductase [Alphaproteobacteria bacterium]|nr:SDR family oxidoreductase [Alphaproteobacteria bacterium]